ncbi:hypothetical protein GGR56DRAFT_667684 [Xylariaceae sp. FL0804]|nr:hypothetical protein GGR56DRAFT_667684 [Xylariaceae sp. FL0804]
MTKPEGGAAEPEDATNLVLSELDATSQLRVTAPPRNEANTFLAQYELFGKWKRLLTDPARLAIESDFFGRGPAKKRSRKLLVDLFANRGDLALWACLLDHHQRLNGAAGVQHVWDALWLRKTLYDVKHPLAPTFWQTLLEGALESDDERFLDNVWIYSEWMYDAHGVKWPQLYSTILKHLLSTHQHRRAVQWHLRLAKNFYPGAADFAGLVKEFVVDTELHRAKTLRHLYIINSDRQLYDTLVPHLYGLGKSQMARLWRRLLVDNGDLPTTSVPVRPFLMYMQGYHPMTRLEPEELAAAGNIAASVPESHDPFALSREFINRVHGETFGISVKDYKDGLGAKWFATLWISLDTAISGVSALGINIIGPLSLQSIALREKTSEGVLKRISQLEEYGISITDSNYVRMVRYLANTKDDALLLDLLESDFHPDVFDDWDLQTRLLDSSPLKPKAYKILLVSKLVALKQAGRQAANNILQSCFEKKHQQGILNILRDMKSGNFTVDIQVARTIFMGYLKELGAVEHALFYLPIFRQMLSMDIPVPLQCWKQLLLALVRNYRLADAEKVSFELVNYFVSSPTSRPGFVPVYIEDIPSDIRHVLGGVENLFGVYIPQDVPAYLPRHPLQSIFDKELVRTMIGYSIRTSLLKGRSSGECASSLRTMRRLLDRGLHVPAPYVAKVVLEWFVRLYGDQVQTKAATSRMVANNALPMEHMKASFDEAWGRELLPPIDELRAQVARRAARVNETHLKYLHGKGHKPIRLGIAL